MTEDQVKALLQSNDHAVERAILALYDRQTASEQAGGTTVESNGKGFNAFDAHSGTYFAQWLRKREGNRLTGKFLDRARKMCMKYAKQLVEIANEKAASKAA